MKKSAPPPVVIVSIVVTVALLILTGCGATAIFAPSTATPVPTATLEPKTYPEAFPSLMLYPISSLDSSTESIANTEGYVIYQQQNPDCPNGAKAKSCQKSYIIVSENNLPVDNFDRLSNQQIVIWVDHPLQFLRLTNYRFTLTELQKAGHFESKLLGYSDIETARNRDQISDQDEEIIRSIYAIAPDELTCNMMLVESLIEQYRDNILACQENADCVPAYFDCGSSIVNEKFKPLYEYLASAGNACVSCLLIPGKFTNIRCENNQCQADYTTE